MLRGRLKGLFRLSALLLLAAVASACRADFNIVIDIEEDGSGLVSTELVLDQDDQVSIVATTTRNSGANCGQNILFPQVKVVE